MSEQRRRSIEELEAAVAELETQADGQPAVLVDDAADASRLESIVDMATELVELQRPDLALLHLENLVRTYGAGTTIEIQREVARALVWQADCLRDLDRLADAGVVAQACLSSYASADDGCLEGEALRAIFDQAWAVRAVGQDEAASALVDQLRQRWKDNPPTGGEYVYMHALFIKALSLQDLGRVAEAINLTGQMAQLFPSTTSRDVSEFAARALELRGAALIHADRLEEAITTLDELLSRFGDRDDLDALLASTMYRRAYPLWLLGRHDEALASFELVDRRFSDATDEAVRLHVTSSHILMSEWLRDLDRRADAIEWLDRTIDRYGEDPSPTLRKDTAIALSWKGQYLRDLGRDPEAANVFDEIIDRYSTTDPDPVLRRLVAGALLRKGRILEAAERFAEAAEAYRRLVAQFDGDRDSEIDDIIRVGREQLYRLEGN